MAVVGLWKKVQKLLNETAKKLDYDPLLLSILSEPDRIVEVSLPLKTDDGNIKILKDFVCNTIISEVLIRGDFDITQR